MYCCIQGDPALNMPLIVGGPETEEEEVSVHSSRVLHCV